MTILELVGVAWAGGFNDDIRTAVAIALAESGGDPHAHGDTTLGTGAGSLGLWQIYMDAHPEFDGVDLYDPVTNAKAAYSVYVKAGHSFTPWSTFKNGAYLKHLPDVAKALA